MLIDIPKILKQGEGISIEFKESRQQLPKNLFETVCAFLNRNGGTILLGVDDDGKVIGVEPDYAPKLVQQFVTLCNNPQKLLPSFLLYPQIQEYKGKIIISAYVPVSSQVHRCGGKVFDRSDEGDFELRTDVQVKNLYNAKNALYSENTIYPFLYESDFKPGIVERCRRIIRVNRPDHPWNELPNPDFYRTAGLYRKDMATGKEGFTMSALLLFGKDETIQSAIPHYKVDVLVRKENTLRYDDRDNIRCNLIEAYDRLMAFVAKHLPDKFYIEGDQRISLREKIFREIVANILIHREYTNAFPTSFVIYKDRVETKNANRPHFIGQLRPGNFEPYPKNPHIAQVFTQMGRSEELGTGIRNVFRYAQEYSGSKNIEFKEEDVFITTIPLAAPPKDEKNGEVKEAVSGGKNSQKHQTDINSLHQIDINSLHQLIRTQGGLNSIQLAEKLEKPNKTIEKWLEKLKTEGKIKFKGSKKTGGYFVPKNNSGGK